MHAPASAAQRRPARRRRPVVIRPHPSYLQMLVPDAMPELASAYAFSRQDELLAVIRHSRLVDRCTGWSCESLGTHLRARVRGVGEVEVDELYVGLTGKGNRCVIAIQARVPPATVDLVQYEREEALCAAKYPGLTCLHFGAFPARDGGVALLELRLVEGEVRACEEHQYRPAGEM